MQLRSKISGAALSFAHLAGIGRAKPTGSRAEQDDEKPGAAEEEDEEDEAPKGKKSKAKAKGAAEDDQDDDREPSAEDDDEETCAEDDESAEDGDDDEDDKASAAEDDGDEDEESEPKGRKSKARAARETADFKRGRKAERKRIAAILSSPQAGKDPALAAELACTTGMSSRSVLAILGRRPAAGAAAGGRSRRNPDLGAGDAPPPSGSKAVQDGWGSAFAKAGATKAPAAGGMDEALRRAAGHR